jgi:hypothetical protein
MTSYAGIGSRKTPWDICNTMVYLARALRRSIGLGWILPIMFSAVAIDLVGDYFVGQYVGWIVCALLFLWLVLSYCQEAPDD